MMSNLYETRLERLRAFLSEQKIELAMITYPINVYYFTGFMTNPHERFLALVVDSRADKVRLFVPSLDVEAAQAATSGCAIIPVSDTDNPYHVFRDEVGANVQALGVEKKAVSFYKYERLAEVLPEARFVDIEGYIMGQRLNKSPEDIRKVRRAVELSEQVLEIVLGKVKAGVTELELVAEMEYQMKVMGADRPSFEPLILSGANSALPHGYPSKKQIEPNEFLLFDYGVFVDGFCSDITRTFLVGEGTAEQEKVYNTVLQANLAAIAAIKVGDPLGKLDRAARSVIEEAGYGPYFNHRVGHGLGLEVHEDPSIHGNNEGSMQTGMLFTIEPGIYLPEAGGVRIEDNIYIGEAGDAQVLTTFPKELRRIG